MTNVELLGLLDRTRREIRKNAVEHGSVPASLRTLAKEIEKELLIRGYDVDYSSVPVEVLANALQDTVHKPYFGKARAGRSMKVPKI